MTDSVIEAVAAIQAATAAQMEVTTGGSPGGELLPTIFPRDSVERRILGFITDEEDKTAFGPRNTLAAVTYAVMRDRNTTHPPNSMPRLDVDGKSLEETAQTVLDHIEALMDHGLVAQRDDATYERTAAGQDELMS